MPHGFDVDMAAQRYVEALMSSDPRVHEQVLAPDFTLWHNTDGQTLDLSGALAHLQLLGPNAGRVEFTINSRVATEDGYVQESTVSTTSRSGQRLSSDSCFVVRLDDEGRIRSVREYQDSASFAAVNAALDTWT